AAAIPDPPAAFQSGPWLRSAPVCPPDPAWSGQRELPSGFWHGPAARVHPPVGDGSPGWRPTGNARLPPDERASSAAGPVAGPCVCAAPVRWYVPPPPTSPRSSVTY